MQANQLEPDTELAADSKLVIPISAGRHATSEDAQAYSGGLPATPSVAATLSPPWLTASAFPRVWSGAGMD